MPVSVHAARFSPELVHAERIVAVEVGHALVARCLRRQHEGALYVLRVQRWKFASGASTAKPAFIAEVPPSTLPRGSAMTLNAIFAATGKRIRTLPIDPGLLSPPPERARQA